MMLYKNIPNLATLLNLLTGCLSVVFAFNGDLHIAAYLIGIATIFDFLDGFLARLLKAYSEFGKQLDSLSDLISFGLAPSVIIYQLFIRSNQLPSLILFDINLIPLTAFLITLFSAMRLAKFNIDERQSDSFIGLPTPANAILIASFPLISMQYADNNEFIGIFFRETLSNYYFLFLFTIISSISLVIELKLFSLKFKTFGWKNNQLRYIFLGGSLLFLVLFNCAGIPLIILFFILLSLIVNYFVTTKR
ncbi:MAG: CDP-diacylglycerol--serine O-phosphatidyltransferase [Bacteroidales bacterium]|nr:CDP-diacylglycerol--serine O-phosphatidyltransferase [Bacteroidales bacterium]